MPRELERLQQTAVAKVPGVVTFCGLCALMLCCWPRTLLAQSATPPESHCISIRVHLNGKLAEGPRRVIFKSRQGSSSVSIEEGCFKVPNTLLAEKELGVSFTLLRDKIYIPAVATGFFTGQWDVELEDEEFPDKTVFPKHTRAREACVVVFHTGDEPERGVSVGSCRTPLPRKQAN